MSEPTKLINVRVPQAWLPAITSAATQRRLTRSEWVRRVIERGLVGAGELPDPRVVPARIDREVETRFKEA